jgi:hypothetical protein
MPALKLERRPNFKAPLQGVKAVFFQPEINLFKTSTIIFSSSRVSG